MFAHEERKLTSRLVWRGSITVGDDTKPNETFHTLVLSAEEGQTGVNIAAEEEGAEFILVSYLSE